MSKKDFELIADALSASRPNKGWDLNKLVQWELDVRNVAEALSLLAPRFNAGLFIDACRTRRNQCDVADVRK